MSNKLKLPVSILKTNNENMLQAGPPLSGTLFPLGKGTEITDVIQNAISDGIITVPGGGGASSDLSLAGNILSLTNPLTPGNNVDLSALGGSTTFTGLTDTPATGTTNQILGWNAAGTSVETKTFTDESIIFAALDGSLTEADNFFYDKTTGGMYIPSTGVRDEETYYGSSFDGADQLIIQHTNYNNLGLASGRMDYLRAGGTRAVPADTPANSVANINRYFALVGGTWTTQGYDGYFISNPTGSEGYWAWADATGFYSPSTDSRAIARLNVHDGVYQLLRYGTSALTATAQGVTDSGNLLGVSTAGHLIEVDNTVTEVTSSAGDSSDIAYGTSGANNFLTHKIKNGVLEISGIMNHNGLPIGTYTLLPATFFSTNNIDITGLSANGGRGLSHASDGVVVGGVSITSGGLVLNQGVAGTGNNYINLQVIL